ncbi:MAG TPA: tryptophan 2,3-dioxygenase family protein [Anaerolineae bacterium]
MTPQEEYTPVTSYAEAELTYNDYLKVPQLLQLQQLLSQPPHHDEMLFIVIHQTYELWFKLIVHELEKAIQLMQQQHVLRAHHFVQRVVEIMRLLVNQIHILETMTAADFLCFRDRLKPASGFQSLQFREIEFLAGLKDRRYLQTFADRPEMHALLERRYQEPDLRTAFYEMLRGMGFDVPAEVSLADLEKDENARTQLLAALKQIYQKPIEEMQLYLLSEALVDFDQYLSLWRVHHVHVVERIIGNKPGTGGSSGAGYLRTTLDKRCFPYLWQVRTHLEKGE